MIRTLVGPVLRRLGIDVRRYWLLMDLFGQIAERREVMTQLGRDAITLKWVTCFYAAYFALLSVFALMTRVPADKFLLMCQGFSAFVMFMIMLSETSNSLVNPEEGMVLAHQPVDGATYTAAKLSHLLRILVYMVPGLNAIPALASLLAPAARWYYPLTHIGIALLVGLLIMLLCCAAFGWLLRFVPPVRLKAAGQIAEVMPFLAMFLFSPMKSAVVRWNIGRYIDPVWGLSSLGIIVALALFFGIRSLSVDYLVRVAGIVHGRTAAKTMPRRSPLSGIAARWFGGPAGRAGFEFVPRMMLRDFQFRRQLFPMLLMIPGTLIPFIQSWAKNPFSGGFALAHTLPHMFALLLFFICSLLPYGAQYKGAWVFLIAPGGTVRGFARGVYGFLLLRLLVIPHAILFLLFAWKWGVGYAALFIAYSLALSACYLALELRLIDGVPFTRQPQVSRAPMMMGVVMLGILLVGVLVTLQYFLVFRSPAIVAAATAVLAGAAYVLTRQSLSAFEGTMRFNLGVLTVETGTFYVEVA